MTAVRVLKGPRTLGRKPRDAPTSPEMPRVFRRYYERFDEFRRRTYIEDDLRRLIMAIELSAASASLKIMAWTRRYSVVPAPPSNPKTKPVSDINTGVVDKKRLTPSGRLEHGDRANVGLDLAPAVTPGRREAAGVGPPVAKSRRTC
jgi:hypothetical protein